MTQKSIGDEGEEYAANVLRSKGVEFLHKMPTPMRLLPMGKKRGYAVYRVIYEKKVHGDIRGVLPSGRSVLAEVKTRTSKERLVWSDLEDHQPRSLNEHLATGGLSLLVFVSALGIIVMEWPVPGLSGPRDGIGEEEMRAAEWEGVEDA